MRNCGGIAGVARCCNWVVTIALLQYNISTDIGNGCTFNSEAKFQWKLRETFLGKCFLIQCLMDNCD